MKIEPHELMLVFALLFALFVLMMWRSFRKWSADDNNKFDVADFVMENGKASSIKLWLNGAFGATTWGFVYVMLSGKGDIGTILGYGGLWVTPLIARMYMPTQASTPAEPPKT